MFDRFTHESRTLRGKIPRKMRGEIFKRDNFTCVYCGSIFAEAALTIDHLIPLALGGLDEMTNYVSSCGSCNRAKGSIPLHEFAAELNLSIQDFPVYGDQILDKQQDTGICS